jgi:glycosyltransferase involved in cell wall biosynthesis
MVWSNIVKGDIRVNVIIPTLNEGRNIVEVINRLKQCGCHDILIVDGHSTDDTVSQAKELGARVIIQNGQGKGGALREAFADSCLDGDVIVIIDADGSMDPQELNSFIEALETGADVVKGSRFLPSGGSEDLTPVRRVGNMILTGLLNWMFLTDYTDLCYGYIAFKKEALANLSRHLTTNNFEIETEICIKSKALGLRVVEIPSFERTRRFGKSNLRAVRDGSRILKLLVGEALKTD